MFKNLSKVIFAIVFACYLVASSKVTASDKSFSDETTSNATAVNEAFTDAITIDETFSDETSSDLPEQDMEVPSLPIQQSNVTNFECELPFPKDKEDLTTSEAASEIFYLVQDSSNVAILIDGFSVFVFDDAIKTLLDELETALTSASNVTIYLCDKDLYCEVTCYEDLLAPKSLEATSGDFFEVVAQLQEENFDRYIIISSHTTSFFSPSPFNESYLETYYTGLFAESDNIPQVMLYTPAEIKSAELKEYLSKRIHSFEENQKIDVTHHFILPFVEQVDN